MEEETKKLTDIVSLSKTGALAIEFVSQFTNHMEKTVDKLQELEKKLEGKVSDFHYCRTAVAGVVKAATVYVETHDDFFYYGKSIDFESIKTKIKQGDYSGLKEFLGKMDDCLFTIGQAHKKYVEEFNEASRLFTECSEKCSELQVKAKSEESVATVGLVMSTIGFFGAFAAGPFGLLIGAASTVGFASSAVSLISHQELGKAKDVLKSVSSTLKDLSNQGLLLKSAIDDLHVAVLRFENNYSILSRTERENRNTLCITLDRLMRILESEQSQTSKAREKIQTFKNMAKLGS